MDGTYEYTYDEQGQLLTEERNGERVNTLTYDDYGNITSKNGAGYTYGGVSLKDQLTRYGSQTIGSYDGNGNPRSYLGKTLVWEKGRQLKFFGSTTYTYNKDGIRTSKTVNGVKHTYVLDGTNIVKETWGSNTLIPLYDLDNSVCGIKYNNTAYYFYKNLQGNVIAITDASGTVIARYVYDAWGRVLLVTDAHCNSVANNSAYIANINPFRYRSYYYDQEGDIDEWTEKETMTQKQKRERLSLIVEKLKELYPQALCALEWQGEPWRLLIMGRLSAQCTDARVNIVCRELFEKYPTPEAIKEAEIGDLEEIIRPCGLYRVKAQNTKDACALLVDEYGGVIPDTMEELLKFPGVGRKVANLLLGDLYHTGGVVADTHCMRICGRFGMYPEGLKDPVKVERLLTPLLEPEEISDFCHRIVQFGRDVCTARNPQCASCPLKELCERGRKQGGE